MFRLHYRSFLALATAGVLLSGLGGASADHDKGNGKSQDGKGKKNLVWCLVSDTNVFGDGDDYSGIYAGNQLPTLTFSQIGNLSTDFYVKTGDCGGGSPRFQISLDTNGDGQHDGNVFVYLGPLPSYTGCTLQTWESSGNLVTSTEPRWDSTQVGGAFYGTYATTAALVGSAKVLDVSLVVDSGWAVAGNRQEICFDDTKVNGTKLNKGFGGAAQKQLD